MGSAGSGVGAVLVGGGAGMRSAPGILVARDHAAQIIDVCSGLPGLQPGYWRVSGLRRSFLCPELVAGRCRPSVIHRRLRRRLQSIGQAMRACCDWAGRGRGVEALELGEEACGLGKAAQAGWSGVGSASVMRVEAVRDLVKAAEPRRRAFGAVLDNGL